MVKLSHVLTCDTIALNPLRCKFNVFGWHVWQPNNTTPNGFQHNMFPLDIMWPSTLQVNYIPKLLTNAKSLMYHWFLAETWGLWHGQEILIWELLSPVCISSAWFYYEVIEASSGILGGIRSVFMWYHNILAANDSKHQYKATQGKNN